MGKTIVMSDLHVSNCARYAWCSVKAVNDICNMLEWIANDTSVGELILLGNLVDLWVYPVDVVPWTVEQIVGVQTRFVRALKECVARLPKVTYLLGNHDMEVTPSDLEVFAAGSKKLRLGSPAEYAPEPRRWHIEHGHGVDMFDASYGLPDGIGGLPFGFFITRLATHSPEPEKVNQLLLDTVKGHPSFANLSTPQQPGPSPMDFEVLGKTLITTMVDVLAGHAGLSQDMVIRFSDPALDVQKITIEQVKSHYGKLLGLWWGKSGRNLEGLLNRALVAKRPNGLDWYAQELQHPESQHPEHPPKLIVLGHTHHAETIGNYVNDGCWCWGTNQTYAVIENDAASLVSY